MKRKKGKPVSASQVYSSFPLYDICGMWESLCGSPGIKIYHDGSRFRLQFIYRHDMAFTVPLFRCWGITFFNFYGIIRIAYNDERDMLSLTTEGEYKRVYDEM
jgi:hypothetical protein